MYEEAKIIEMRRERSRVSRNYVVNFARNARVGSTGVRIYVAKLWRGEIVRSFLCRAAMDGIYSGSILTRVEIRIIRRRADSKFILFIYTHPRYKSPAHDCAVRLPKRLAER